MENKKLIKWRPCSTCKYDNACGGSGSNPKWKPCEGWQKKTKKEKSEVQHQIKKYDIIKELKMWYSRIKKNEFVQLVMYSYNRNEGNIKNCITENEIKTLSKNKIIEKLKNWEVAQK